MLPTRRSLLLLTCISASASLSAQTVYDETWCQELASSLHVEARDIGEAVSAVVIDAATWVTPSANAAVPVAGGPPGFGGPPRNAPLHCRIDGHMTPIDNSATARSIHFGVALPPEWNGRAIQMGGGGMNGSVPGLSGFGPQSELASGYVTYGSDSGHQLMDDEWALNDEAIRNLAHMQMKKTRDAAMAIIQQAYGQLPEFNYYVGGSQGGREALTVAQRYADDYDGVLSTVPIVGFSTLMTAPTRIRIQEKALANWVPPQKGQALLAEFMRQCDNLDGLNDGIINNYVDCRAIFNVNDGLGPDAPWQALLCPGDTDPAPDNAGTDACLTSGQIETLDLLFSDLQPGIQLPNGRSNFGMWAPTTAVANSGPFGGLFSGIRYQGQEGAAAAAPVFSALGSIGVNGIMMQDINADPLDFNLAQHGARYQQLAPWLDSTQADLGDFAAKGGKLIVIVGTDDTIAPSGEQLNYYQSVVDTMGRAQVDAFARLWVLPQTGHGLSGRSAAIDGNGASIEPREIPATLARLALLTRWVEEGEAPGMSETVTGASGSLPICGFPTYPHYMGGNTNEAGSYNCASPTFAN